MSDVAKRELAAAFRNRGFVVVFAVMLLAALGLNTAVRAMNLHFQKARVELQRDLERLPSDLGPWLKVIDTRLDADIEHTLGTKEYLTRTYVDTRKLSTQELDQLKALAGTERERRVGEIMARDPAAVMYAHVAYYTGMVDTVAHVPERCMVGGGFNPENPDVVSLPVFRNVPGRDPNLKVKYIEFRDKARPTVPTRNVAYVFQVNGKYEFDSLKGVRLALQDITEKYGYYAKIELATFVGNRTPADTERAQATMTDFLSYAMPELEKCLPDWHKVTGQVAELNRGQ